VHAIVGRYGTWFVAECLEIAVVTQGRTLDETAEALREAVALHLEAENASVRDVTRELAPDASPDRQPSIESAHHET
jgi:predicted RNase H-like HicB family nuclease